MPLIPITPAPSPLPGRTRQTFPTQDIATPEITEDIGVEPQSYTPIPPETPHPNHPTYILVKQEPVAAESADSKPFIRRTYMVLPGAWVTDTRLDPDGVVVNIKTRKALSRLIVSAENVTAGIWTKTTNGAGGDAVLGDEVAESRAVPGNPVTSAKPDPDGILVTTVKTLKESSTIVAGEPAISGGVWSETVKEPVSQLVAYELVKSRVLPGRTMIVSKQEQDGAPTTITRTLKDKTTITPGESPISGGIWTRVLQEDPPVFRGFELRGGSRVAWEIVETRAIPGNPLPSTAITKDGDIITETKTLVDASTISSTTSIVGTTWTRTFKEPFPGSAVVAWKVQQVRTTAASLPFYSVEIPDIIPPKMRAALPLGVTETTVKGTASQPSLSSGDFFRSQQQLDEYTYRLKVTNLALGSLPIIVTDKSVTDKFGGGPTTITWTLSATLGTVDAGLLVLSSRIDFLGNSLYFKTTETRDGSAWPQLSGTKIDKQSLTAIPFTSQVVAAGAVGSVSGNVITEVEPLDYQRSRQIISTIPTSALDTFFLKLLGTASFQLPNVLTSIAGVIEKIKGDGGYSETGTAGWNGHGSWSLSLRGSGQASASILPDVVINVQQPWANEIPVQHLLFFMPSGSAQSVILTRCTSILGVSVSPWPKFRPVAHTLLLVGKRMSIQVNANNSSSSAGDGTGSSASATSGTGETREVGISFKSVHIPPTIHGTLSITPNTDSQAIGPVTASINVGYLLPSITRSDNITGYITPTSLAATGGDAQSIPTSGLRLYRITSEPYSEYPNYIKVHCEIVDFADIA